MSYDFDRPDLELQDKYREPILFCGECGAHTHTLVTLEDRDDSVGYSADVSMCPDCMDRRTNRGLL